MNTIDFTPLYRNSIGFDRFARLLDQAMSSEAAGSGYPPYDIEMFDENRYGITLAVAGFEESELDIQVEQGVLTVHGKHNHDEEKQYLYHGIATREFERKFNLADHVEVTGAELKNGLLKINLVKEVPEAMKPRRIEINQEEGKVIEHHKQDKSVAA